MGQVRRNLPFILSPELARAANPTSTIHPTEGGEQNVSHVELQPGESQEQLLKRFRKSVAKSGVLSTVRRKRWHVSKSELRRIQKKKAIRRARRKQRKSRY
jgi:small subunit ribosomal protein S21